MEGGISGFGTLALMVIGATHVLSIAVLAWAFVSEKQIHRRHVRELHKMLLAQHAGAEAAGALAASLEADDQGQNEKAPIRRVPITPH